MNPSSDRRARMDGYMIRYGRWARSERGISGYPRKSTLYNVIHHGPDGAAAIRAATSDREEDHPLEECIEEAIRYMNEEPDYQRVVKCLKARYVGLIRSKYYTDLPDVEAARFLGIPRQRYYEDIDRGLRFIDGWLVGKKVAG